MRPESEILQIMEVFDRLNPILVFNNCYFAIVRSNGRGNSSEVIQSVVIYPYPIFNIASDDAFSVKITAIG